MIHGLLLTFIHPPMLRYSGGRLLLAFFFVAQIASGCAEDDTVRFHLPKGVGIPISLTGPVSTVAGLAYTSGTTDGNPGTSARFSNPLGMASDGIYLYISDYNNHRIRRMHLGTTAVTTFVGDGTGALLDGTGTGARVNFPIQLVYLNGNLYLADRNNNAIRRINTSTGVVTTIAGNGGAGSVDGIGAAATFNWPHGITHDGTNLFVVETAGHVVRKIRLSDFSVTTLAGLAGTAGFINATGGAARFSSPKDVAFAGGNLYIADSVNQRIRKLNLANNAVTTLAGDGTGGSTDNANGLLARFNGPETVKSDGYSLFVGDGNNDLIRRIDLSSGAVSTVAGVQAGNAVVDGSLAVAEFDKPIGLVIVNDGLYISDFDAHTLRRME